jgi:hypothetical protein
MAYCFVRQAVLIPGVVLGDATTALGGFAPGSDVHWYQAFAWELITTFILVFVVFSVALSEPNFGDVGPLIVGLTVTASAFVSKSLSVPRVPQSSKYTHTPTHSQMPPCMHADDTKRLCAKSTQFRIMIGPSTSDCRVVSFSEHLCVIISSQKAKDRETHHLLQL